MNKTYRAGYVDAQRGLPPQSNGAEYVAGYNAAVEDERRSDPFNPDYEDCEVGLWGTSVATNCSN